MKPYRLSPILLEQWKKYYLTLITVASTVLILLCSASCVFEAPAPEKPKLPPYQFKYGLYPQVENLACYDGLLSEGIAKISTWEEKLLREYAGKIAPSKQTKRALQLHDEILNDFEVIENERTEQLRNILDGLVGVIRQYDPSGNTEYYLFLVRSKNGRRIINAFTTGSYIYVTEGLLSFAQTDAELAHVIGHELGHSLNGHCANHILRESIAHKVFGEKYADQSAYIYEQIIRPCNQVQELECDLSSAFLCYHAGYDPEAGLHLYRRFEQLGYERSVLRLLQSHPMPPKRLACLNSYLFDARARAQESSSFVNTH